MASRRKRRDRRRAWQVGVAGIAALALQLTAFIGNPALLGRLSGLVFDEYQRLKPRVAAGAPLVILDIDEASIREVGQWPWARTEIAAIVDRLRGMGAAAIGFDMVFSEPDRTSVGVAAETLRRAGGTVSLPADLPENDAVLAQSFAANAVTAGFVLSNETEAPPPPPKAGFAYAGAEPETYMMTFRGALSNLPALTEAAAGMGFYSFPPSADGIVRTVPLVARSNGQIYPALSIEALRTALGASSFVIRATGASGEADTGQPAMTALKVGNFEVPTGPNGDFRVYFSGLPDMPRVSAAKLLSDDSAAPYAEMLNGSIVLVGTSALGLRDLVATPVSPSQPGVEVHAEIIDQILGGEFLTRPDWAPGAEILGAVLLTLILLAVVTFFGALIGAGAAAVVIAIAIGASWLAFSRGHLVLDPILPTICVLGVYLVATTLRFLLSDRERKFVRLAFSQYLSPAMVERLAEDPTALALGGETREITILFSDIRSFTSISERLDPQQLTSLLNRFLTPMTDVLLGKAATIDKYIGDAIMAFWNAPVAVADHPRQACLAALGMFDALEKLNRDEAIPIKIGVGLNTGDCCVGNLGSEQRFNYSAIGDAVNVAARVEGLTKQYGLGMLVSENTVKAAGDLAFLEVDRVQVVGRAEPLAIFALLGDDAHAAGADFRALSDVQERMLAAYRARDFGAAADLAAQAKAAGPPSLAAYYDVQAARIAALAANPPGPDWDGVYTFKEK